MEAQPSGIEGRRQMPQFNLTDEEIREPDRLPDVDQHDPHAGLAPERRRLRRDKHEIPNPIHREDLLHRRHGALPGAGVGRAARRLDLRHAQHALRARALQHRPDAAHQQPRRVASARLLRRGLLHRARGGGARDLLAHARLSSARDPRARHAGRRRDLSLQPLRGQLPPRNAGPRIPRTADLGQDRHRRRRAHLPLQRLDDRAQGPQDRHHQRPAARPVGPRAPLPLRLLQPVEPRRSTRCTGGT